jgi:hypothetical protein
MQYVSNQRNRVRKNGKFNITTPQTRSLTAQRAKQYTAH